MIILCAYLGGLGVGALFMYLRERIDKKRDMEQEAYDKGFYDGITMIR